MAFFILYAMYPPAAASSSLSFSMLAPVQTSAATSSCDLCTASDGRFAILLMIHAPRPVRLAMNRNVYWLSERKTGSTSWGGKHTLMQCQIGPKPVSLESSKCFPPQEGGTGGGAGRLAGAIFRPG
jgi:hypothetical protein